MPGVSPEPLRRPVLGVRGDVHHRANGGRCQSRRHPRGPVPVLGARPNKRPNTMTNRTTQPPYTSQRPADELSRARCPMA